MKINLKLPKLNLALQLILLFAFAILFGNHLNPTLKSFLFAVSGTLKEILLFILPFIIFVCLFNSMVSNQSRALSFVVIVFLAVSFSNLLSILAAYGAGTLCLSNISFLSLSENKASLTALGSLEPLWSIQLPSVLSNKEALISGLIMGILCSLFRSPFTKTLGHRANEWVTAFLGKVFVPFLPLFAFGFILKMEHDGILEHALKGYGPIVLIIFLVNLLYLALMFGVAAGFNPSAWFRYIKNVLPAGLLGFSTMSSLATMPVTLHAAEKNTENTELSRAIIPATVNIHMIGDSFAVPIIAMAILLTFGQSLPNFAQYLIFTQLFMMAKFAIPGVPSGSMLVMIPVLEGQLGFTPEMSAFMTAIYILFDPISTATNVLGNSALVIMLSKIIGIKTVNKPSFLKF